MVGPLLGLETQGLDRRRALVVLCPLAVGSLHLLLVDATYGKVIERKHVAAYDYERPAPYTPRSASHYAGDENCEPTAGY